MAEKSFGIKELNLIGASGTPTIESPNNLNLNAVNVAISTNATVGGTLNVGGDISLPLKVTANSTTAIRSVNHTSSRYVDLSPDYYRSGSNTGDAGIFVSSGRGFRFYYDGDVQFRKDSDDTVKLTINKLGDVNAGVITATDGVNIPAGNYLALGAASGTDFRIYRKTLFGNEHRIEGASNVPIIIKGTTADTSASFTPGGAAELYWDNSKKLETTTSGVNIDGSVNIVYFSITASGTSAYRFSGGGVDSTEDNPDIYLVRGYTYRFYNTTGTNHPFAIRSAVTNSGGTNYTNGVSGSQNNYQTFTVPLDAPSNLYYQCTIHTQNMQGNIYIRGGNGANENVGVTTFTGTGSNGAIHLKSGVPAIFLEDTDGTHGQAIIEQNGDDLKIRQDAGNASSGTGSNIRFEIDATERLRIRSNNGDILFGNYQGGGTNQPRVYFLSEDGDFPDQTNSLGLRISNGYADASIRAYSNSNGWNHVKFYSTHTGSIVTSGSISQSGGNTISYNTSSDYRLKENEVAISDGITRLKQLKPYRFNFKTNTSKIVDGFFAHEVSDIVPEAITGEKDGVVTQTMIDAGEIDEAIGTPVYQQIDQAKLVPVLTAALQEAISKIETLEAKVAALEGS